MAIPNPLYRQGQQYPMFNLPGQTPSSAGSVSNIVPNFSRLSQGASGIINSGISGLPSASPARRANAYFGASSGMPGSDFVRNRGFDLYGEQADAYQQRGLDNFLKLLQGYSGTVMPTAGQQIQNQQFNRSLQSDERQADANMALNQQQQFFNEMKAGRGVPWNSNTRGEVTDRFGGNLGYDRNYDRVLALSR